jgi:hypothetical protein
MELRPYVESIQNQMISTAEAVGDDAVALLGRLAGPLEAAIRLALQDLLAAAADEITCELAPGAVELRLRGREPELVVIVPPAEHDDLPRSPESESGAAGEAGPLGAAALGVEPEESGTARLNVRMPEQLKARIERAAAGEAMSANTWIVRAALAALDGGRPTRRSEQPGPRGSQRLSGWVR